MRVDRCRGIAKSRINKKQQQEQQQSSTVGIDAVKGDNDSNDETKLHNNVRG